MITIAAVFPSPATGSPQHRQAVTRSSATPSREQSYACLFCEFNEWSGSPQSAKQRYAGWIIERRWPESG